MTCAVLPRRAVFYMVARILGPIVLTLYYSDLLAMCESPRLPISRSAAALDRQPQLAWSATPGATAYRVRLQSRVPNGRVVASHDTVVTTPAFRAPQPLAEQRAKVTVRLSAVCGAETSAESVWWFVIDTSAACRLGEINARAAAGKARVDWKPVPEARTYDVRVHALADGRLIASRETRASGAELELREAAVVSVRPACAAGLGEAVYRVVAAD
jgi:hypothetical protein